MSGQDTANPPSERTGAAETGSDSARDGSVLDTVAVDHAPSREAQVVTVAAALVGTSLTAPFTVLSIPFGVAGFAIVAASVFVVYSVRWLSIGVSLILAGAFISGAFGVLSTELLLLGAGATLVGWDAGQHGIVLGEQVGRQSRTRRNLLIHVAATGFTLTLATSLGFAVFLFARQGQPAPAVSVVALGTLLLAWSFRR